MENNCTPVGLHITHKMVEFFPLFPICIEPIFTSEIIDDDDFCKLYVFQLH